MFPLWSTKVLTQCTYPLSMIKESIQENKILSYQSSPSNISQETSSVRLIYSNHSSEKLAIRKLSITGLVNLDRRMLLKLYLCHSPPLDFSLESYPEKNSVLSSSESKNCNIIKIHGLFYSSCHVHTFEISKLLCYVKEQYYH